MTLMTSLQSRARNSKPLCWSLHWLVGGLLVGDRPRFDSAPLRTSLLTLRPHVHPFFFRQTFCLDLSLMVR